MASDDDMVLRPVVRGMCKYESLVDFTLNLVDVLKMNDCLNVLDENEARLHQHLERKKK